MSNFNQFAKRANEICKAAFAEHNSLAENVSRCQAKLDQYPYRSVADAEYLANQAKARAAHLEAESDYKAFKGAGFDKVKKQLAELRAELSAAVDKTYAVNPSAVDMSTIELLKSGIMTSKDYISLVESAIDAKNYTMARMIGKYAKDKSDAIIIKDGRFNDEAKTLTAVYLRANRETGSEYLEKFDLLSVAFDKTTKNPLMIQAWDSMTENIVENF